MCTFDKAAATEPVRLTQITSTVNLKNNQEQLHFK